MSAFGPSVWTGRALQAESDDLEKLVLRFCIRPMMEPWSSWPSWISARVRSHSRLGHEGGPCYPLLEGSPGIDSAIVARGDSWQTTGIKRYHYLGHLGIASVTR